MTATEQDHGDRLRAARERLMARVRAGGASAPPGQGAADPAHGAERDGHAAQPVATNHDDALAVTGTTADDGPRPERLDMPHLAALRESLGDETIRDLLGTLGSQARALPAGLAPLAQAADLRGIDALLHSLKGACATLSLRAAAAEAHDLRSNPPTLVIEAEELASRIARDLAQLRRLLD